MNHKQVGLINAKNDKEIDLVFENIASRVKTKLRDSPKGTPLLKVLHDELEEDYRTLKPKEKQTIHKQWHGNKSILNTIK